MSENRMNAAYFEWMYHLVCKGSGFRGRSWRKLFHHLNNTEFTYLIDMDGNRANDGIDLRYRYAYEHKYDTHLISEHLYEKPCSVLEMMLALALRCEEQIMDDPDIGNRTSMWLWDMVVSLGLSSFHDEEFDKDAATAIISKFLKRNYEENGRGSLFVVGNCPYDLRSIEIWYQMMWYLNNII